MGLLIKKEIKSNNQPPQGGIKLKTMETAKKIYEVIKNVGYPEQEIYLITNCPYEADEAVMNLESRGYPSTYRVKK